MKKYHTTWLLLIVIVVAITTLTGCQRRTGVSQSSANQPRKDLPTEVASQPVVDSGDLLLRYQPRKTSSSADHTVGTNRRAIEKLIAELNERLIFPFDLQVSFEDCDLPDAFYDPETHNITICYQLIDSYYELFATKIKDKSKLNDAVRAGTVATFFHELGHGLIDAWKLPTTGREEDAADQLSTLVLLEATKNGEEMALNGALLFKLYAEYSKGAAKIYWDEHSIDEQRFFDTLCLVYGKNDEKYDYLVEDGTLPEERAMLCVEEYEKVNRAWRQLLTPYLKRPFATVEKLKLNCRRWLAFRTLVSY